MSSNENNSKPIHNYNDTQQTNKQSFIPQDSDIKSNDALIHTDMIISDTSSTNGQQLTFAIAQSSFLVGDIKNNTAKMKHLAVDARAQGADIIIFPELSIIGYPPEDLLLRPSLSTRIKSALSELSEIKDIVIIVGYPHIDHHGTFNSAAILHNGQKKGFYHKQHLPNYGVFDERRYFDKGRNHVLFDYKGVTIALLICEDLWASEPISNLKSAGSEIVIVLNASPFEVGKQKIRKELLSQRAKDNQLPIVYANCVGGQDDLVFDGGSMVVQADGSIAVEAARFLPETTLATFNLNTQSFIEKQAPLTLSEDSEIYQALVVGLRDYVNNAGFNGVIVGLSGGIDSALTLCIAVDALGSDKVYAVMMPYKYTSQISLEDAQAQARRLNVSYTVCPIFDAVDGIRHTLAPLFKNSNGKGSTEENIQARARGMVLMALSNKFGHLVITTGNKTELAIGYSTLYGDMAGGFDVLKDVYKSKIYELANYRNRLEDVNVIPERVINKPPSAELRPEQLDADHLPDYDSLDAILTMYVDADMDYQEIVDKGFEESMVAAIIRKVDNSEYKRRQSAIGTKISHKAFGRERRYPLINAWSIED